ncbi:MAG: DUF4185 domain-containing protein [Cytophagia bacterium]|nr:MAG: DUF4185 domain-containing protein [Cytophagia bacterium]
MRPNYIFCAIACLSIVLANTGFAQKSAIKYHRQIKYPESNLIAKFEWTTDPEKYPGTGSDMHWWTWGIDDAIYVIEDDGSNFGGPGNYAHLLKVTGVPPKHKVETITDFMDIPFRKMLPNPLIRRYVSGTIAVDSVLYVSIYDYDWNIPRVIPFKDSIVKRTNLYMYNQKVKDPALLQTMYCTDSYSKHFGTAGIIKSTDFGKTWTNIPDATTPRFLGPDYGGLCFLNFGPGYSDVPEELGPYVYTVSNDSNWESGDHVRMARVHKDSVAVRSAWQFLSKISPKNKPTWSKSEEAGLPILTDLGHVGHPTISYNKTLKRYILAIFSDEVVHQENATIENWKTWDQRSELQLYESEKPWGPWKIFHNEIPFGGENHTAYLPQIPNKWWEKGGLNGTLMFAGDYTKGGGGFYALMTQSFKLTLKKKIGQK